MIRHLSFNLQFCDLAFVFQSPIVLRLTLSQIFIYKQIPFYSVCLAFFGIITKLLTPVFTNACHRTDWQKRPNRNSGLYSFINNVDLRAETRFLITEIEANVSTYKGVLSC
jgi:hypothetical protein